MLCLEVTVHDAKMSLVPVVMSGLTKKSICISQSKFWENRNRPSENELKASSTITLVARVSCNVAGQRVRGLQSSQLPSLHLWF